MSEVTELPSAEIEQVQSSELPVSDSSKVEGKPMSEREFKIAVKKAYAERNDKIKQNKLMVEELGLEVAYWKSQSDLLKYRYEKMDYYLKNLDIEPLYLAKMEEQRLKEEQANLNTNPESQKILS